MKQYLLNFLEFNLFDITMILITDVLIPICTLVSTSFTYTIYLLCSCFIIKVLNR